MTVLAQPNKIAWWPRFIITTFIFFAFFIGYMVRQAMQTDVDLVSADYYKKEIAYQQHMDKLNQTQQLSQPLTLVYAQAAEQVSLVFPAKFVGQKVKGNIHLFRPSDAKLDLEIPLQLNSEGQQFISTAKLAKGFWRAEVSWESAGKQYYMQQDLAVK